MTRNFFSLLFASFLCLQSYGQTSGSVTLSPTSLAAHSSGEVVYINVTTSSPDYAWTATSDSSWINIISGASGTGNGQVGVAVDRSKQLTPRSGTVNVSGQVFSITQAGVRIGFGSSSSAVYGKDGGSGTLYVGSDSFSIDFTPVASANWITISLGASREGVAPLYFTVAPNPTPATRVGTIKVADATFTITEAGSEFPALRFIPIPSCRLVDTRNAPGTFSGPNLAAFQRREFPVIAGQCNIPSTAKAYLLNVTAVPLGPLGYLSVYPTGANQPDVSTLNSYDGRVVANAAIVPAGSNGAITLYATEPTNVVVDVNGYFDDTIKTGYLYFPQTPCRLADTRVTGLHPVFAGLIYQVSIPGPQRSCQPVIEHPAVLSLNVTAVPLGPLGFMRLWPVDQKKPEASTLNSYDGSVVANAAIVPVGQGGVENGFSGIYVELSDPSNFLVDINGYFDAGESGGIEPLPATSGFKFYPVPPCRVADTRNPESPLGGPSLAANTSRDFTIPGVCNVPTTARAYSFNVTVVPKAGTLHFLTLWPSGQSRPEVSTLNSYQGKVLANAAIVPAGTNGAVSAYATEDTELIIDVNGYFAP